MFAVVKMLSNSTFGRNGMLSEPRCKRLSIMFSQYTLHGRTGREGGRRGRQPPPPPPSLLGKQTQSGNIRFTVGQYWLIIKIMSILWEILSILWEIFYLIEIFRNHSSPLPSTTILESFFGKFF